jgi:hypothetical protein
MGTVVGAALAGIGTALGAPLASAALFGAQYGAAVAFAGGALLSLGASSAAARSFAPEQSSLRRALEIPRTLVVNRTAYGRTLMTGSPLLPYKDGRQIYGAVILSNRPSSGGEVFIRSAQRPAPAADEPWGNANQHVQGNVFDFSGLGLAPQPDPFVGFGGDDTGADFFRVWIGRGSQTAPPDRIMTELLGERFALSDSGQGMTVLWYRMDQGDDNEKYFKRWPGLPREFPSIEVLMDTTRVWDPRDPAQDPDLPNSWTFSDNQALCLLDAIRLNPIAPWQLSQIDLQSFIDGADIADEDVALKRGGTEKRYTVAGTIQWTNAEIMAQIEPLARAGGGRLIDIGGRIGYAPGAWQSPVYTVTDALDDQVLSFGTMRLSRDVPSRMLGTYTDAGNAFQTGSLPPLDIADGAGADQSLSLTLIDSPTRAARLQKLEAARVAAQKTLSLVAPPSAAHLVPWSNVTIALPGFAEMDGTMRVLSADPTIWLDQRDGAAMRVPLTCEEHSAAMYDWAVDDEPETLFNVTRDVSVAGEVTMTGVAPTSDFVTQVAVFRATTGAAFTDAVQIGSAQSIENDNSFSVTATCPAGAADFWLVALDDDDAVQGTPSGAYALTIS